MNCKKTGFSYEPTDPFVVNISGAWYSSLPTAPCKKPVTSVARPKSPNFMIASGSDNLVTYAANQLISIQVNSKVNSASHPSGDGKSSTGLSS